MLFEYVDTKETFTLEEVFQPQLEIIKELEQEKQEILLHMSINNYNVENSVRAYTLIQKIDDAIAEAKENMESFKQTCIKQLLKQHGGSDEINT